MLTTASRLLKAIYLFGLFLLLTPVVCSASGSDGNVRLSIEGISASVGEDEPRVLTILPWRAPTLPRRPRAELESSAPGLVQPLNPLVLERHREFRRSLTGMDGGVSYSNARNSAGRSGGRQ